ncbi:MFS transporter [Crystallibacter degradans]|uniref:MFS transporter n=1 Tax=Crystallibacter degradans TaxID=2726743 RepID=UPI00147288FF|nr:MHS family MFS transporter [Arthrobacter sp. SF27]
MDKTTDLVRPDPDGGTSSPKTEQKNGIRKVIAASTVGTSIEYYDYFIFGTAAATVFPQLFFPQFSPLAGTLAAFATFGAGFFARPLGAAIAGHFGDRIGRKSMLVMTLLVMGVATFAIGLLPGYDTIGIWAPILLVVLRLIQGFGVGGELPGAQLMCVEHAPANRRGFFGSWPQSASPIGLALATGAFVVIGNIVDEEQFMAWGWRIPFLFSGVLVLVGIFVRLSTHESPVFKEAQKLGQKSALPIGEYFSKNRVQALRGIGMYLGVTVIYYIVTTFMMSYTTGQLEMNRSDVLNVVLLAQPVFFVCCLVGGALSDRIPRHRVYALSSLGVGVVAFPSFALIDLGTPVMLFLGVVLLGGFLFLYCGVQGALFAEMFDVRIRYTGMSLSIALATLIGGAFTPALGTLLVEWFGGRSYGVSLLVIAIALIAAASAHSSRKAQAFSK